MVTETNVYHLSLLSNQVLSCSPGVGKRSCCPVVSPRRDTSHEEERFVSARSPGGARQRLPVLQGQVKVRQGSRSAGRTLGWGA